MYIVFLFQNFNCIPTLQPENQMYSESGRKQYQPNNHQALWDHPTQLMKECLFTTTHTLNSLTSEEAVAPRGSCRLSDTTPFLKKKYVPLVSCAFNIIIMDWFFFFEWAINVLVQIYKKLGHRECCNFIICFSLFQ